MGIDNPTHGNQVKEVQVYDEEGNREETIIPLTFVQGPDGKLAISTDIALDLPKDNSNQSTDNTRQS